MRLLFLILPLALAACADPAPLLPHDEALAAYDSALARGDADYAIAIMKRRARAGDVWASADLAVIYQRGYASAPASSPGASRETVAVRAWPGQARLWRGRYERQRDEQARAGNLDALMLVAQDLEHPWLPNGNRGTATPADMDSVTAIRQRLVDAGHVQGMFHVALVSLREEPARADSLFALAEASGSFQACTWRVLRNTRDLSSAHQIAKRIDSSERCRPLLKGRLLPVLSEEVVAGLRTGVASGSPEAVAHLDSLRALGVFERHPHLAQI